MTAYSCACATCGEQWEHIGSIDGAWKLGQIFCSFHFKLDKGMDAITFAETKNHFDIVQYLTFIEYQNFL